MIILSPIKDRRTGMLLAFVIAFVVTLYPVYSYSGAWPYDFDYSGEPENDDPFRGGCIYNLRVRSLAGQVSGAGVA
jgi:hypothetical protein